MTQEQKLIILKKDLQRPTNSNDDYLRTLLDFAVLAIQREGIRMIENDLECEMAAIHYAAYLFRKRAAETGKTGMPRFLRYELNNLLMGQKGRKE